MITKDDAITVGKAIVASFKEEIIELAPGDSRARFTMRSVTLVILDRVFSSFPEKVRGQFDNHAPDFFKVIGWPG